MKRLLIALVLCLFISTIPVNIFCSIPKNSEKKLIDKYEFIAKKAGTQYSINWTILYSIFYNESRLKSNAVGDKGKAIGLGQVHLKSAKEHYDSNITKKELFDPIENAKACAAILKDYLTRYNNNYTYALASYNAGPKTTDKSYKSKERPFNMHYVISIYEVAAKRII